MINQSCLPQLTLLSLKLQSGFGVTKYVVPLSKDGEDADGLYKKDQSYLPQRIFWK